MLAARALLALAAVAAAIASRWHLELIYPIERAYAGQISSGFVTLSGTAAVRFDHALFYLAVILLFALAVDYLRLVVWRNRYRYR